MGEILGILDKMTEEPNSSKPLTKAQIAKAKREEKKNGVAKVENVKLATDDLDNDGLGEIEEVIGEEHDEVMYNYDKKMTVRELKELDDKNLLNFDLAIQRGKVWKESQKSLLINSLIVGMILPQVVAGENDDELHMLDGKQRLTTIMDYINNDFKLDKGTPNALRTRIAELSFSELPEKMQQRILNFQVSFVIVKKRSSGMIRDLFARLNNGTGLTAFEKLKSEMSDETIDFLAEIAEMPFWKRIPLSADQLKHSVNQEMIFMLVKLFDEGACSLERKDFIGFNAQLTKMGIKQSIKDRIRGLSTYLNSIEVGEKFKESKFKQYFKLSHTLMTFMVANTQVDIKTFTEQLIEFHKNKPFEYTKSMGQGSAKSANVVARVNSIKNYFSQFNYPEDIFEDNDPIETVNQ